MIVQELYSPKACPANTTTTLLTGVCSFGGFLCTTAGNFSLTDTSNAVLIPSFPVTVGQFVPAGFICGNGAQVVTSGGCVGTALFGTLG